MATPTDFTTSIMNPLDQLKQQALEREVDRLMGKNQIVQNEGRKDDMGKLPWHLLPPDAIEEILEVLKYGADKYAPRNWEQGMHWSRPFAALMRHMWAWWRREPCDNESGISHLAHAGCCLLFLLSYELRKTGKDDRP